MTPAIWLMFSPAMGRTDDAGWGTRAVCAPTPRKPTSWYRSLPWSSFACRPSAPMTGRADSTGVTVVVNPGAAPLHGDADFPVQRTRGSSR